MTAPEPQPPYPEQDPRWPLPAAGERVELPPPDATDGADAGVGDVGDEVPVAGERGGAPPPGGVGHARTTAGMAGCGGSVEVGPARTSDATEWLPPEFCRRTEAMLGDEFADFVAAMGQERVRALRINPAKTTAVEVAELLGVRLEPVPWCPTGFVLPPGVRVGGHPAHLAGLFYVQEPSSMFAAQAALCGQDELSPGTVVADVAAAPGGKTTHLAGAVGARGLVVAGEVIGSRMRPLHDSLDLWGAPGVITTNREVADVANAGPVCDVVVLDAPCSGEGLFRRDPDSVQHWSVDTVQGSAGRQAGLIRDAAKLVAPGGMLVYSTCTFAPEENEQVVADFVTQEPDWIVADMAFAPGIAPGEPISHTGTEQTARLWPHRVPGEGQYVALLHNVSHLHAGGMPGDWVPEPGPGENPWGPPVWSPSDGSGRGQRHGRGGALQSGRAHREQQRGVGPDAHRMRGRRQGTHRRGGRRGNQLIHRTAVAEREVRAAWQDFHQRVLPGMDAPEDRVIVRDDRAYLAPETLENSGFANHITDFARPGMPLGRVRPGRFEPHPGLATGVAPVHATQVARLPAGSPQLAAYLRGETVPSPGPDGWVLVSYEKWGLGWAKRSQGVLKNFLPGHVRAR